MKKSFIYALLSAIALTGAVGFSSCSSTEDTADVNPNYNPETDEVNVDFVFNVSTSNEATTRMSSANTQATLTQQFRGITDAYLASYSQSDDGKYLTDPSVPAGKLFSLGPVVAAGKLNNTLTQASGDVNVSHRVLQLSLASGTNSLLFWGKAPKTGTDLDQGRITMNISETPSETSISMCKIVPDVAYTGSTITQAKLLQYENLIANILTYIINSGISSQDVTFGATTNTVTINWKDYVTVTGDASSYTLNIPTKDPSDNSKDLSLLGERLSYTFKQLNTIHANELRAGYGKAVSDMMTDLMGNINQVVSATPLNMEEAVAQAVATEIKTRVEKFFDPDGEYNWLGTSAVKTAATFVLDDDKSKVDNSSNLNQFPSDFNLPLGSVLLELNIEAATAPATGYKYTYNYSGTVDTYAMGGGSSAPFDPKNYMFPAELCYFGNSPIRVTNETKAPGDYPDGVANWEASGSWTGWTTSHVTSSTRSVAMKDNINYGTALLETKVRYGAQTLQDNNHNLQDEWSGHLVDEPNNTIDVNTKDDHFVLTGILVGGQNPEVGWNYIAKANTTGFGAMVYDRAKSTITSGETTEDVSYIQIPKATASTGGNPSVPMYTLLWDNWDQSLKGQKQRDVYIAVEFKNNSKDFYGENNLIRNGGTFYIVGKLDPNRIPKDFTIPTGETNAGTALSNNVDADKTLYADHLDWGVTWPTTNYALPPYETEGVNAGNGIKERRVFIQDYLTSVTFVIGETSLQHALVAVPDLRSGQISLGLSVDLSWRTGITFGDIVLGE